MEDVDPASLENLPSRPGRRGLPVDRSARRRHPRHPHRTGGRLVLQAQPQPDQRTARFAFAPLRTRCAASRISPWPAAQAEFMDLAGDGQPDLVVLEGPRPASTSTTAGRLAAFPPVHVAPQPRHPRSQPEVRGPERRRPCRRADHRRRRFRLASPRWPRKASARPAASIRRWMKRKARAWSSPMAPSPSISPT